MTEALTPRWQDADEAVASLVAALVAAAARTADHSGRKRPRGRERRPKSTRRHIAEVIRAHKLAPGLRVDRNMVAALLIGHRNLVSNPVLVVAVAQACAIIAGRKLGAKKAAQLRAASRRVAKLIARAEADMDRMPSQRTEPVPANTTPVPARRAAVLPPAQHAVDDVSPAVPAPQTPTQADVRTPRRRRPHPGRKPRAHRTARARRRRARRWWLAVALLVLVLSAGVAALLA